MWHSPRSAVNKFWWRVKLYSPTPLLLWFPTFCKLTFIPRQTIITINMELGGLLIVISSFLAAPISSSAAGLPLVDESRNLWKETLLGIVGEGAKHILSNGKGRKWKGWIYMGDKAKQKLFPRPKLIQSLSFSFMTSWWDCKRVNKWGRFVNGKKVCCWTDRAVAEYRKY